MHYLDKIQNRRKFENSAVLLHELEKAFSEHIQKNKNTDNQFLYFYNLLRFSTDINSLAPWLEKEADIVHQAQLFAEQYGAEEVGKILAEALKGQTQPEISFTAKIGDITMPLPLSEDKMLIFNGKNWGSTDIALSFAMEPFEEALLDAIFAARETLKLDMPQYRQKNIFWMNKLPKSVKRISKRWLPNY